jgi:hypothetical protein
MLCTEGLVNSRAPPASTPPSSRAASTNLLLWKHRPEEYPDLQATTPTQPTTAGRRFGTEPGISDRVEYFCLTFSAVSAILLFSRSKGGTDLCRACQT